MSIWKSPVFYFGIVLVLLVTAALAAPYLVPWNSYRGSLEAYGQKLTGRNVSIGGDIAVKLFPWPQLEAQQLEIGNPEGFSDEAFFKADLVQVTLSLGGLFNGNLDVEEVKAVAPIVNLQRNASGEVNWIFEPTEQVTGQGLLSRVKLDKIQLSKGVASFDDLRNGHGAVIGDLDATLSAQSILGPWRMRGSAKWNETPLVLNVTTNAKSAAEPLTFSIMFEPTDVAYPMLAVEGAWNAGQFDGAIRVDPQQADGEKASAEGALKPLAMQAKIAATEERLNLTNLRIAPADRKDSGTLIEGAVVVEFGTQSVARVELKSPRINLDTLMGAESMQQWREGGLLSVANAAMAHLPARMVADYSLNVSVLTSGGQALNDVRLAGSIQNEAIRVTDFAADLPGRSSARFDGVIFPGDGAAQLGGKLAFESADFRAFLSWMNPAWKLAFDTHWTGSRGRFTMPTSTLDWTARSLSLKDVEFEFEGAAGTAEFIQGLSPVRGFDVRVALSSLDVDSLLPNGWSLLRDGGAPAIISMAVQPVEGQRLDVGLDLSAQAVQLNGVAAQKVELNLRSDGRGLAVDRFKIGNVGGAELVGGGKLADEGEGPAGTLNFNLRAEDPRGFIKLAGLDYGGGRWTDALGQTAIDATIEAIPQKTGPELKIAARGSSGPLNIEMVATAREIAQMKGATLAVSGGVNTLDSAALARLVGILPATTVGPGDLTFEFNGSLAEGFAFGGMLKALDGIAELSGTANPALPYYGINGKFTAKADDGQAIVLATGLPIAAGVAQPLDLSATLSSKDGALDFLDVKASFAGRRFSGAAGLTAEGRVQADIETDLLDSRDVFALAFMPLDGPLRDLAQSFANHDSTALLGEVFLRPLQFETGTGVSVGEVVVGIGLERDARLLNVTSPGEQGLTVDLRMQAKSAAQQITGKVRWPLELSQIVSEEGPLPLVNGQLLIDGEFSATGRSPAAALASLQGKGNYWLTGGKLTRMTLDGLQDAVVGAATSEQLTSALGQLTNPPGTEIGQRIGNFNVANGEISISSIDVPLKGLGVRIAATADLTANRMRMETTINMQSRTDLPAIVMTYEGPPGSLVTRVGTSAIAAKLGYELLSKEMAELERLQEEQRRLALKEEEQRKDDEKRFAEYQATRLELREQARVRRFQASQREKRAADIRSIVDEAIKNGAQRSRIELLRHARRLAVRRGQTQVPAQP